MVTWRFPFFVGHFNIMINYTESELMAFIESVELCYQMNEVIDLAKCHEFKVLADDKSISVELQWIYIIRKAQKVSEPWLQQDDKIFRTTEYFTISKTESKRKIAKEIWALLELMNENELIIE